MKEKMSLEDKEKRLDEAIAYAENNISKIESINNKEKKLAELVRKHKILIKSKNPFFRLLQEAKNKISNYNKNYYGNMEEAKE